MVEFSLKISCVNLCCHLIFQGFCLMINLRIIMTIGYQPLAPCWFDCILVESNITKYECFKTRTGPAGRPGPGTGPGGVKNPLGNWPGQTRSTRDPVKPRWDPVNFFVILTVIKRCSFWLSKMPKTWRWLCLLLCCHGSFSCCTSMSATCPCLQLYYPRTHHHQQSFNTHLIYLSFKKTLFILSMFIFIFKKYLKKLFFYWYFLYFYILEWKKIKNNIISIYLQANVFLKNNRSSLYVLNVCNCSKICLSK
jgi:hypothetical protein